MSIWFYTVMLFQKCSLMYTISELGIFKQNFKKCIWHHNDSLHSSMTGMNYVELISSAMCYLPRTPANRRKWWNQEFHKCLLTAGHCWIAGILGSWTYLKKNTNPKGNRLNSHRLSSLCWLLPAHHLSLSSVFPLQSPLLVDRRESVQHVVVQSFMCLILQGTVGKILVPNLPSYAL